MSGESAYSTILWFISMMLMVSSRGGLRSNMGLIIPADTTIKSSHEALYDPSGKKPAPTHLEGVTVPTTLLYNPGSVMKDNPMTASTPSSSSKAVVQQPLPSNAAQNRPFPSQSFAGFISNILGSVPFQNILSTPSSSGTNIQIVQPFYARPNGYYYGPASITTQTGAPGYQSLRPMVYGSYQRHGWNNHDGWME